MNKLNNHNMVLFVLILSTIFLSSCDLIDTIQGPNEEIVKDAVTKCMKRDKINNFVDSLIYKHEKPYTANFKITNKWKKTINNEKIFFYETELIYVTPKLNVGDLHSEQKCLSKRINVQLIKRGNSWYSLTSNCSMEDLSEVDCSQKKVLDNAEDSSLPKKPTYQKIKEHNNVVLSGIFIEQEGTNKLNEPVVYQALQLNQPIIIIYKGQDKDEEVEITILQLVLNKQQESIFEELLEKQVRVSGEIGYYGVGQTSLPNPAKLSVTNISSDKNTQ